MTDTIVSSGKSKSIFQIYKGIGQKLDGKAAIDDQIMACEPA